MYYHVIYLQQSTLLAGVHFNAQIAQPLRVTGVLSTVHYRSRWLFMGRVAFLSYLDWIEVLIRLSVLSLLADIIGSSDS